MARGFRDIFAEAGKGFHFENVHGTDPGGVYDREWRGYHERALGQEDTYTMVGMRFDFLV